MNPDELIEKCRLTDEEIEEIWYKGTEWGSCKISQQIADAQLHEAIPIIEAEARKAERERIINWLEQFKIHRKWNFATFEMPNWEWQALKEEG